MQTDGEMIGVAATQGPPWFYCRVCGPPQEAQAAGLCWLVERRGAEHLEGSLKPVSAWASLGIRGLSTHFRGLLPSLVRPSHLPTFVRPIKTLMSGGRVRGESKVMCVQHGHTHAHTHTQLMVGYAHLLPHGV